MIMYCINQNMASIDNSKIQQLIINQIINELMVSSTTAVIYIGPLQITDFFPSLFMTFQHNMMTLYHYSTEYTSLFVRQL